MPDFDPARHPATGPETVGQALVVASATLGPVSDTARLDAELLMASALGVTRNDLLLRHKADRVPDGFAGLIARRLSHEPVAYILGQQPFYGLDLTVSPAVLIPRADSETLIEAARAAFGARMPGRVIDLGTGSGALLLAALDLWPGAQGIGIDRSPGAIAIARDNAARLGLAARARFVDADWTRPGWNNGLGRFDLLLANPPYVEDDAELAPAVRDHEPAGALFAGPEGLDAYRVIVPQLRELLVPGGVAVVEIGWTQADPVGALARTAGFEPRLHLDLGGRPRAIEMISNPDEL